MTESEPKLLVEYSAIRGFRQDGEKNAARKTVMGAAAGQPESAGAVQQQNANTGAAARTRTWVRADAAT